MAKPGMISAATIAEALARVRGERVRYPSEQQRSIIESDPQASALVVAGAGSGKTETMANRVLWLVANAYALPNSVLGLTFTRKAAGELASRIRERLSELHHAGLTPGGHDSFAECEVSTYNSFASNVFRDNALVLGRESDGNVLGDAAAWQLARKVVVRSSHPGLSELDKSVDQVVRAVLDIARGIADNDADPERLRTLARRFLKLDGLPSGGRGQYLKERSGIREVALLEVLVDLAGEYEQAKKLRGVVDYADQVRLAVAAIRLRPEVASGLRARFHTVLLDEYQDTSVIQTELLATIFADSSVLAVGDPHQSIYGWRGASATNLRDFSTRFSRNTGQVVRRFSLSTSWRNGENILRLANTVVANAPSEPVEPLRARPDAPPGLVEVYYPETLAKEASALANWFRDALGESLVQKGRQASAALLLRNRNTQGHFLAALKAAGVPYHVLGGAGLFAEPEVADLLSALRVVADPGAGVALLRLLAGARWQLGVSDLDGLRDLARWLSAGGELQLSDELRQKLRDSLDQDDDSSLSDALAFLPKLAKGHPLLARFSEVGLARLRDAAHFFAQLRARSGGDLSEFVSFVIAELNLDLEIAANETRVQGQANLDKLREVLADYLRLADSSDLKDFLSWVSEAENRENLSPRSEAPEPGTVQVLTIHGAKGLEWDLVAIPRLVEGELPGTPREGLSAWLGFGRFPWPERGDVAELPRFDLDRVDSLKAYKEELARFRSEVSEHYLAEERRLVYVAITRARERLLLTGSFWAGQRKARLPSVFLRELSDGGVIESLSEGTIYAEPPEDEQEELVSWPQEPFGARRERVLQAANRVRVAKPELLGDWAVEAELLLREKEVRDKPGVGFVPLPARIPASQFKEYLASPEVIAQKKLRPMPVKPYRETRLGTLFHSWVEQRYGVFGGSDVLDAESFDEGEFVAEGEDFAAWQETFARSPWGSLKPVEVEREILLPFAGRIVVCKIDAVYRHGERFEVVDWKTGKAPKDANDLAERTLQLALYRLAYARWSGIPPESIDAAFFFVADNLIIRPERIDTEQELLTRWHAVFSESR